MATDARAALPLCARCKEQDGVLDLRSEVVCQTCFTTFVASKTIKRLEVLQRETRGTRLPSRPQRYLVALSRGPSSTALLHILSENMRRQRERNQRLKFELVPVFIDVDIDVEAGTEPRRSQPPAASDPVSPIPEDDGAGTSQDAFAAHFPELTIHTVPLSDTLSSRAIDWSALPAQNTSLPPSARLADFFSRLPSASARADVERLLIRHAVFAAAAAHGCAVVLLGYTTTALAELTLAEAAKGRGFGIPWFVNDGAFPLPLAVDPATTDPKEDDDEKEKEKETVVVDIDDISKGLASSRIHDDNHDDAISLGAIPSANTANIHVYSPLREIFRKEILSYLSLVRTSSGPLTDLFPSLSSPRTADGGTAGAVVSHRDQSLDDVVTRFFADVEASYPSVVANVVRTTGKLNRAAPVVSGAQTDADRGVVVRRQCSLCGVGLDLPGDERWKGEIGEADVTISRTVDEAGYSQREKRSRLCYGCERSVRG